MPFDNLKKFSSKKIHFIGIGGIGMSAVAHILHKIGCLVQGSDLSVNNNIKSLQDKNIKCFHGHNAQNISDDVALVIATSIIDDDNPEILQAKSKNIPIIKRADMLAKIMENGQGITVAGTHGKTSTTAMIAVLLENAGLDPMVINGGVINNFASNAKFGKGKFIVAESDESDGSFVNLPSFIGVIGNIEPEHMEFYDNDFSQVKNYYQKYVRQIPDDGLVVMGIDDLEVNNLYEDFKEEKKNIKTVSVDNNEADFFADNIILDASGLKFDVKIKQTGEVIKDIKMSTYGIYNVKNALAALAIGNFLGFDGEKIKQGLAKYLGVKRRFSKIGEVNGVAIIDDYAHHPTEIQAVFKAAKQILPDNKLIAVFQPHKYSRTRDCFDEFCHSFKDVDIAIIADIYCANQEPIAGINQDALIAGIKKTGHKNVVKLNGKDDLADIIRQNTKKGDMVICAGAGSITLWANQLPQQLLRS